MSSDPTWIKSDRKNRARRLQGDCGPIPRKAPKGMVGLFRGAANTLIGFIMMATLPVAYAAVPFERCVVEVLVTAQTYDPSMPWRRNAPEGRNGFGVMVAPGRVLTVEDLVRNQVMVELRRPRSGVKLPAQVLLADHQAGLALLSCATNAGDPAQLEIAETVRTNAEVTVVQFDETGSIQTDQGRLIEYSITGLPSAPSPVLQAKVLANLNTGDRGAPVFYADKLAGLVVQSDRSSQTFRALPYPHLRRFIQQAEANTYKGIASAGFAWKALVDPVRRAFYNTPKTAEGGIEVTRTFPNSGAATALIPGDIILRWDGSSIDAHGFYTDPEFGHLMLPHLISGRRIPGDTIQVELWRQKRQITVPLTLTRRLEDDSKVPENILMQQPEYIVESGFVFRELGGDYLRAHGNKWLLQANPRLVHLYLMQTQTPQPPGWRVVFVIGVLPDAINIGYQQLRDMVVNKINGKAIANLGDVARIIAAEDGIRSLFLQGIGQEIVLDQEIRKTANQRISAVYRIPSLQYIRASP